MKKYTFILSTGRTGTLFFTRFFASADRNILSLHEPRPSYHLRILSNYHSSGNFLQQYLLPIFLRARKKIFSELGVRNYVEANNFLYGFSTALQSLEPAPTILHIVRDPREYIRSYLNHGAWYGKKWLAARFVPFWQPKVKDILNHIDSPVTPISRFAAIWTHINRFLLESGEKYPNYHCIRFEDIFQPPYAGLDELSAAVGLSIQHKSHPAIHQKVNPGKRTFAQKWTAWTDHECRAVHAICGDLMQSWGYGVETEWLERVSKEN